LVASARLAFHAVTVPDYPLFEQPPYELALAAAIVDVARAEQLDIVHAHYGVPHAASAYLARQALASAAPRVVTTLHGTDVTGVGAHPSYRSITRFTVAASDALTVPSEFLRRAARDLLGEAAELPSIEVIPNFVDTEQFVPAAQRDRSCFDPLRSGRARRRTGALPRLELPAGEACRRSARCAGARAPAAAGAAGAGRRRP
jgi:glycosyltransferase involved in cell wall biosynthesis